MSAGKEPSPTSVGLLILQVSATHRAVRANTEGLTQEDALVQPTAGGNCLNWVLGHIMDSRNATLRLLGREPLREERYVEVYRRGSPPLVEASNALPLGTIMADYEESQGMIVQGLRELTAARLAEGASFGGTVDTDENVGSVLARLVFHEAYHAGQTGVLRRIAGRNGAIA
ncbi:MAG: DinB family protein [Gemmatimonadota bacterium]|nr:MAG: DinB family protein [Gemmatimonadota bacterium]